MVDGTYSVEIESPVGRMTGRATIRTEGNKAFVKVSAPVIGRRTARGRVDGNKFSVQGSIMVFLVGRVTYSLDGEVIGDDIHIYAKSNRGDYEITGTRSS